MFHIPDRAAGSRSNREQQLAIAFGRQFQGLLADEVVGVGRHHRRQGRDVLDNSCGRGNQPIEANEGGNAAPTPTK